MSVSVNNIVALVLIKNYRLFNEYVEYLVV